MPSPTVLDEVQAAIDRTGPPVDPGVLHEFVTRLDTTYFDQVLPEDVAAHVRMAAELSATVPARLRVTPREAGGYDVTVVAFDHFGVFALICGLLAANGLSIESGHVHTFTSAPSPAPRTPRRTDRRPRPAPRAFRKIVDVFHEIGRAHV